MSGGHWSQGSWYQRQKESGEVSCAAQLWREQAQGWRSEARGWERSRLEQDLGDVGGGSAGGGEEEDKTRQDKAHSTAKADPGCSALMMQLR